MFKYAFPKYRTTELATLYPHNFYIQILSETGFITFAIFIFILFHLFKSIKNKFVKTSLLAVLIQNFSDYNLSLLSNGLLFWFIAGIGYGETTSGVGLKPINPKIRLLLFFLLLYIAFSIIFDYLSVVYYNAALKANKLEYLQISLKFAPDNWLSYETLGDFYFKNYQFTKNKEHLKLSVSNYENAITYNKLSSRTHLKLANLYKISNESEKYYFHLKEALKVAPHIASKK